MKRMLSPRPLQAIVGLRVGGIGSITLSLRYDPVTIDTE
jgi:hypothetical protein